MKNKISGWKFTQRFFLCICFWFMSGCAGTPDMREIPIANAQYKIYFIYRSWHTSILLDAKILARNSPLLADHVRSQQFVRIGWGDGDYFTGKRVSWSSAARALVASKYPAIQVLGYEGDPFEEIPADTRVPLLLTADGLRHLIDYINSSIALDERGLPIQLAAMGAATGEFFQANGHYSMLSNCNTWSGQALRAAGLPVSSRLTAQGVFEQARSISRAQSEAGLFK